MSKIKNGGLDQYGAESFKQQQFGTAGVEGVNVQVSAAYSATFQTVLFIIRFTQHYTWNNTQTLSVNYCFESCC